MLQLHTDGLDVDLLKKRLDSLLDQGLKYTPESQYSAVVPPSSAMRKRIGRWPWLRRLRNLASAWRLSGWSMRWLVRRTPVLGPLAWHAWGKLTLRAFRQHTLAGLDRAEAMYMRHQERIRQIEGQLAHEVRLRQDAQIQLAQTISRLQLHSGAAQPESSLFAAWYLALENQCRGEVADIEARLDHYLPHLDCAQVGQAEWPVLDLGCGRGEWLRLLARHQMAALGVDNNAAMLDEARQQGLQVVEADLITFLRTTDAESIGAITAFQVVEHLPQNTLLELFQQAWRVLRPGGVLLLETPNPENLQVAAYSFWLDPTHVRPIPAPLLAHSAAYFGFIDISIERSNPWSDTQRLNDPSDAARHLEKLLFSAQDYALVARKPYAQEAAPELAEN
ncbi:MAG: methyltransferase domain-containing protein [Rugosibacter sp.]